MKILSLTFPGYYGFVILQGRLRLKNTGRPRGLAIHFFINEKLPKHRGCGETN